MSQPSPHFQPVAGGLTRLAAAKRAVAAAVRRFNAGPANDNGPGSQYNLTNEVDRIVRSSGGPADLSEGLNQHELGSLVGGPHYLKDGEPNSGSPPSDPRDGAAARNEVGGLHHIPRITPESGDGQGS